jgi:hypothetical protein
MHLGKAPHWAWVVVAFGVVGRHIVLEVFLMLVSGVLRPEVTIVKMLDASVDLQCSPDA